MVVVSSGEGGVFWHEESHTDLDLLCPRNGLWAGQNRTMTVKIAGMGGEISKKEMTVSKGQIFLYIFFKGERKSSV